MRTVGFELEMSDIKTSDAAEIVYGDLSLWSDRYGAYSKPHLEYDRWHLQSDGSIRNNNKTRCMVSYLDESGQKKLANPSRLSPDRFKWQGAELISPVFYIEYPEEIKAKFEEFIYPMIKKGAVFERHLYNSLHVHVDISDVDLKDVMFWMKDIAQVQDTLDSLGNDWKKRNKISPSELMKFMDAADHEDVERFTDLLKRTSTGESKFWDHDDIRKIVDVAHRFRDDRPNTIEFRCFSPVPIWSDIELSIKLCVWLVEQWKDRVPYIKYYQEFEERVREIKKQNDFYYTMMSISRLGQ